MTCGDGWAAAIHDRHEVSNPDLPEGRQKDIVRRYCTACHSLDRIRRAGGTRAGWLDRIDRMQRWGAKISPLDVDAVATYLASALPPRPRASDSVAFFANQAVQEVREQEIQTTLRFAARAVAPHELVLETQGSPDVAMLETGQRARAFAPRDRASAVPGMISVSQRGRDTHAMLRTARALQAGGRPVLVEVSVNRGRLLAVANDAILMEGDVSRVIVEEHSGQYELRRVKLGIAGDQATQVSAGLGPGERVITLGAFFVHAEQRLDR